MESLANRLNEHLRGKLNENEIKYAVNPRTNEIRDIVIVNGEWEFHLSADGYGVYAVNKVGEDMTRFIHKDKIGKKIYKKYGDEVLKFVANNPIKR